MKKLLSTILSIVLFSSMAQKPPIKFGDVPLEDLKMTNYDLDSSAVAVVLADYGESSLIYSDQKGFVLNFERLTRIKILKKGGLEWGNFTVPLYHNMGNSEKISGLKAVTYNLEDGKVVETKVKNESIFKEKYDMNFDVMKIALPKVKEGSVVEITYKISSDFIAHFQNWEFQNTIPIRWSEYRANIPEYFNYDKYMHGYIPLTVVEETQKQSSINIMSKERVMNGRVSSTEFQNDKVDFQEFKFRWAAKDVPAFKEEPYMTTYKDYISKINFELAFTKFPNSTIKNYMGSWEEINDRYVESEDFGGVIKGNGHLKQKAEELTNGLSAEEKISAIHQYVRDNFLWDGTKRKFVDTPIRKVADEKKGSSAEINLLMASMLEKIDIEVYPILISTRDNGFVRENLPISTQFNYTICLAIVGESQILLDATQKLLPTGLLPERCLNGKGLLISKNGYNWVNLAATLKSKTYMAADFSMDNEGSFSGKLGIDRTGYFAEQGRRKYFSKGKEDYVKEFIGGRPWEISKSSFDNTKELTASLKETHELTINDYATVAGDLIYFNPLFINKMEENPFKLEKREYPVDFGSPFDQIHFSKILIPENFTIEELPASKAIALPNNGGRYFFNAIKNGNLITVTSNLQINQSLFTQNEYHALREFYAQAVAKQAEQIVLKRK